MKRMIRIVLKRPASIPGDTVPEPAEYCIRVVGTDGRVLTEIDELRWEAIRPYIKEYDGQFERIEIRSVVEQAAPA